MKKRLSIEGMSCGHCVARVKSSLAGIKGVASVNVDLATKSADVEGSDLDDGALRAAVVEAGYEVVAIQ